MNPFSGKFLSNCSFVLLLVAGSERLHTKTSLWKARKAPKDQKKIFACALENGYPETGKAQGERLCRSLVLETIPCDLIKIGFHHWYFLKNVPTFFGQAISQNISERLIGKEVIICLVRQIIIASARQLLKCKKRSTVIAFRLLVKSQTNLKGTKPFARRYSIKHEKTIKVHWKESLMEFFYWKVTASKLHWIRTPSQMFPYYFC